MFYAGSRLGLEIHWFDPFLFIIFVVGGALVYGGVFIMIACISFWADAKTSHYADDVQY